MKKILLLFVVALLNGLHVSAQQPPSYDFHPPLKIPLVLSSNFGELRPNHFHMGLDFKTNNKEGYKLYAIEDGFVSRIKVSTYGYGKVIYIDHPNGITSVYAHCSEFKGPIDSLVRATQKAEQNFEVEIFPGKNTVNVKRGDVIALSGNSGGSSGPHLHFELRDTKTEHALNPLLYGFDIADSKAPEIRNVKVYGLSKDGYRIPGKEVIKAVSKSGTGYIVSGNQVTVSSTFCSEHGGLGLAFDAIDRFDGAGNQCGLYGSYLIVDGDTIFGQQTKRIPFESTRYVNSHKDYEAYQNNHQKFHKCFRTSENDLPIYINDALGIIAASPGSSHAIEYIAFDAKGNQSKLSFTLKVSAGEMTSEPIWPEKNVMHPQLPFEFSSSECSIEAGYATVYEPMKIDAGHVCDHLGDREEPVNRAYTIKLKASAPLDGKHYIEIITAKGKKRALNVEYQDGWAVAESKYFGAYALRRDEIAPTTTPVGFTTTSSTSKTQLSWTISDNASGIDDYDLFIDGEWHLIEYDYKSGKVTFQRPASMKGKKALKLVVKDSCGNAKTWEGNLTFL